MMKFFVLVALAMGVGMGGAYAQSAGGVAGSGSLSTPFGASGNVVVGGPSVEGDVNIEVTAGNMSSTSNGEGAIASNRLGAVTSGRVDGDVDIEVNVGNVRAESNGRGACSENLAGAVGAAACSGN